MSEVKRSDPTWVLLVGMILAWIAALTAHHIGSASIFFEPVARFSDFFEVVYAIPREGGFHPPSFDVISQHFAASSGYNGDRFTIMHLAPFSMLLTVIWSELFTIMSPVVLFWILSLALVLGLFSVIRKKAPAPLAFLAVISYPVAFMLDRGNLYAGLCGLCLVAALLRRKADWTAAILFAVALNIRPNALPMLLPFIVLHKAIDWRFGVMAASATAILGIFSALAANFLYPAYTLSSFQHGMDLYVKGTLNSPVMLAYGSSIYSALFTLGSPSIVAATILTGLLALLAILSRLLAGLEDADFTFICAAVMALGVGGLRRLSPDCFRCPASHGSLPHDPYCELSIAGP